MQRLKEILVLLLLLLFVVPQETFAQSAGGQISRKPKTAARKNVAKKTPSKSTAKKPVAKRETCPPTPTAVDLGLSSGTLWADRNIGALSPEGYGDYFAWGETHPKSVYDWSTYKYCRGTEDTITKYCDDSSYGTVDNKTILEPSDDAATVNWGYGWRMPTHEEQMELREKCKWTWTTCNGVKGYKVVGPNGNSIFLPAAGYRSDSSINYAGSEGFFWVLLNESVPNYARGMYFSSGYNDDSSDLRCSGFSVRAVVR